MRPVRQTQRCSAIALLATGDAALARRLDDFRRAQSEKVMAMKLPEV